MLKEVTCLCGWRCRGTDDEVVAQLQAHLASEHNLYPTREEILSRATVVDATDAGAT